jgi:molecular chaperone GrpE
MATQDKKGGLSADIPTDAVEEALRAVEKRKAAPGPEVETEVQVEVPGGEGAAPAVPAGATLEGLAAENAQLAAQLELSQAKGRETLEKLKEEHDRFLRAAADLENYKKRAQKEREEVQRFGNERLLKDLIPVVDNLERALAAVAKDDPLSGGVRLVLRQMEDALGRFGVKAFSAMGQPFDPRLHEALMSVATAESTPGTVVMEHGRGYLLNDRLVRPAIVGVAVAPGAGSEPGVEAGEDHPAPASGAAGGTAGEPG